MNKKLIRYPEWLGTDTEEACECGQHPRRLSYMWLVVEFAMRSRYPRPLPATRVTRAHI